MMAFRAILIATAMLALTAGPAAGQYAYDPSDFATEVVDYYAGNSGHTIDRLSDSNFKDPQTALGRPTVDTTGDDEDICMDDPAPVNPVYPAFRSHEICTIGYDSHYEGIQTVYDQTGYIELKFDHMVYDNPLNPYGCDFIVFGNTRQTIGSNQSWYNENPANVTVGAGAYTEAGVVLVSQDGETWYRLPEPGEQPAGGGQTARGADDYAPTLGRVYDPANPDTSINTEYWTNQWWGHATNPTYPLDPSIGSADFDGMTVAQIASAYKGSAGGTGLDLQALDAADYSGLATDPNTGMKWIQYIRIENPKDENGDYYGVSTEVDAVADVFARLPGDINLDGVVDAADYIALKASMGSAAGVDWWEAGDFDGDGVVGWSDLQALIDNFGLTNGEYGLAVETGGTTPAVPTPSTLLLLGLAGPALLGRKRR